MKIEEFNSCPIAPLSKENEESAKYLFKKEMEKMILGEYREGEEVNERMVIHTTENVSEYGIINKSKKTIICLTGERIGENWEYKIIECELLITDEDRNSLPDSLQVKAIFEINKLTNLEIQEFEDKFLVMFFSLVKIEYFFKSRMERDEIMWSILTLYYLQMKQYPRLFEVNIPDLNATAVKNGFGNNHQLFQNYILQYITPRRVSILSPKEKKSSKEEQSETVDQLRHPKRGVRQQLLPEEISEFELLLTGEKRSMFQSLKDSKNIVDDYKKYDNALRSEKTQANIVIVENIKQKQNELKSLGSYVEDIDSTLDQFQRYLNKYREKLNTLRKGISSIEIFNNRLCSEKKNKKSLYLEIERLLGKYELDDNFVKTLTFPDIMTTRHTHIICNYIQKLSGILNDTDSVYEKMKVVTDTRSEASSLREICINAVQAYQNIIIIQLKKELCAYIDNVTKSASNVQSPTHGQVSTFMAERKTLFPSIHCLCSPTEWIEFIREVGESQYIQMNRYLDYIEKAFEHYTSKEKTCKTAYGPNNILSFLKIPPDFGLHARESKLDLKVIGVLLTILGGIEQSELLWKSIFTFPAITLNETSEIVQQFLSKWVRALNERLTRIIERAELENPVILGSFLTAVTNILHCYKMKVLDYKLYDQIDQVLQNFELNTNFESETFKKSILAFEQEIISKIKTFLARQSDNLDNYACNTRQAGVLLPTKNVKLLVSAFEGYTDNLFSSTLEDLIQEFEQQFLIWLEEMGRTKMKYYNIVLLENYHYLLRATMNTTNPSQKQRMQEIYKKYELHIQKYVKSIYEYQYKTTSKFFTEIKQMGIQGDFRSIPFKSGFAKQNFLSKMATLYNKFPKSLESMAKRMNKHFSIEEEMLGEMWVELCKYIISEHEFLEQVGREAYDISNIVPSLFSIKQDIAQIDIKMFIKK